MLGKLFKYDFFALYRVMRFVILGILCLALLLTIFAAIQIRQDDIIYSNFQPAGQIMDQLLFGLIFLSALGMGAGLAVIMVFIYVHYYRNLFSDEGYLTHTLPVKSWEILFSKLLSAVVWILIGGAAIVLGLFIIFFGATSSETLFNTEVFRYIAEAVNGILSADTDATSTILLVIAEYFASLCSGVLQVFLAITIGCAIANKHRIWAAVGIYAAIVFVNYIFNSIFSVPLMILLMSPTNYQYNSITGSFNIILLLDFIKNSGVMIGCFFWIKYLMKRRLNLQ